MAPVWSRWRAELRRRWRAWLAIAFLVGLAGGAVTGLVAGARRTDSAYHRFLDRSVPADLVVLDLPNSSLQPGIDLDAAARLPGVAASAEVRSYLVLGARADGRKLPDFPISVLSSPDGSLGQSVERRRIIAGRRPDPGRPDELLASFETARRFDLEPGSVLEFEFVEPDALASVFGKFLTGLSGRLSGQDHSVVDLSAVEGARPYRFEVVGITAAPIDFPPLPGTLLPLAYATPAFEATFGRNVFSVRNLFVRLGPDEPVKAYQSELERQNPQSAAAYALNGREHAASTQRLVNLQSRSLWLLAGFVVAAATLILAQTLLRQTWFAADDHPVLRALGMSRRQLWVVGALRAAAIALAAAGVVALVAVIISPFFPFGLAGRAEPSPGFHVDVWTIAVGAFVTGAVAFILSTSAEAWRVMRGYRSESTTIRRSRVPRGGWGSLTFRLGSRLALDPGRGRTAVPVRSTLVALTVGVTAAALSVTVVASLDRLTHTPQLYGWQWDAQVGAFALPDISEPMTEGLLANPAVESLAVGGIAQLEVDGVRVDAYALDNVRGTVSSALIEGRPATRPDEIVLGSITLDDVGARVGDTVHVAVGRRTTPMRVVGRAVFPSIGDAGQLGRGARLTFGGLEKLAPGSSRTVALLDVADGRDPDRVLERLRSALALYPVFDDRQPDDLVNLGNSYGLPVLLVLTIAGVAGTTLAYTLTTSIRRRRRDLAVLKAMGLTRGRLSRTVAWQATVLSGLAVAVGIPLGAAAGRWAWILVGHEFGFPAEAVVPVAPLAAVGVGMVLLANLVAAAPGWAAARTPAAQVLRAE